jgi:hypothetical protein
MLILCKADVLCDTVQVWGDCGRESCEGQDYWKV